MSEQENILKISKDNLFLWSRVFPGLICLGHIWVFTIITIMVIQTGFYLLVLIYFTFFAVHFFWAKVHKFFLAKDIYLIPKTNQYKTIDKDGNEEIFECINIRKATYKFGLVRLMLVDNQMIYFFIREKKELTYITNRIKA